MNHCIECGYKMTGGGDTESRNTEAENGRMREREKEREKRD